MEEKGALSVTFTIIAVILGAALFRQFDFETLKFDNLALAIVYMIGFAIALYVIVTKFVNYRKNKKPKLPNK